MILDRLEHADIYESVHPGFKKMVTWMRTVASPEMSAGRYEIEGCEGICYAYKIDKASRPYGETPMDKHSKFIDFHLLLEGEEILGWQPFEEGMEPCGEVPQDNIVEYKDTDSISVHVRTGDFYLVWPHELHKSACHFDEPYVGKKIVGKLLL